MAAVSDLEITISLGVRVAVRAGTTPQEAANGLFRTDLPSRDLVREIFLKLLKAVENGDPTIDLSVPNPDGTTIERDPSFPLPPIGSARAVAATTTTRGFVPRGTSTRSIERAEGKKPVEKKAKNAKGPAPKHKRAAAGSRKAKEPSGKKPRDAKASDSKRKSPANGTLPQKKRSSHKKPAKPKDDK
jgi:hypothetical protein